MAAFELLAAGYFLAFAIAAAATRVPLSRRIIVAAAAAGVALVVVTAARTGSDRLRAWLPHAYLAVGYWLPALLTPALTEATRFERWLVATDLRLRERLPAVPRPVVHLTELAYLVCYPLVPAAFIVVWTQGSADDVQRFWAAVLLAGYACYASLPWLLSRPPRLIGPSAIAPQHVGAVNVFVLGRVSHQLNTFPSGHVAVSIAAAAAVAPVSLTAGAVTAAVAVLIAVGAVAGRYHYVIDVAFGAAAAAGAVGLALAASR